MDRLRKELYRLKKDDPDFTRVLDICKEIDRVYNNALKAMGVINKQTPKMMNSSKVTISLKHTQLSSEC